MKCSNCGFENREGVKFCEDCGAAWEVGCPKCGATVPAGRRFCGACGHRLTSAEESRQPALKPAPLVDPIAKLRRYLPTGLAEKILAQRDRIEGERRQVTVLFGDLAGFTPLSEKLGPEDAYTLMDQVYEILIHKVHDFEGTVNEMTGDGVMALFGAPIALEDAPQRAIRSALAIHREMARLSEQLQKEGKDLPPLRMRVGIHTGPVVVGTLGNDLRVEFKAVGDTVNLACRLEGLAEPGTTYVTADTFHLTEGFFRFEGLGKKEVKGKAEPIDVYRVLAPSTRRTRFDVSAERGLTPFVGRQRELELLLDAYDRAKSGRGQAVSIVADAGVGKSRLLYEFRKAVTNEDATFLEGKCLSYSRGVACHPVIDILKGNFDIRDGEDDPGIRDKVKRGLKVLQTDEPSTLPYLLELLSVKESGIDQIQMSPEGKRDQTLQALIRIVLKGSEIRPLILSVEDLHWIDKTSEEAFKDLLERIAGARVLLLFTYRTEYVHTWGGRSYHSQVTLNRLSNREAISMVTHLLGTESVAENLTNLVLEKTEGVPFFIEEFVKSLRDLGIIERHDFTYALTKDAKDVAIPSTIQDVILARVDALPEDAKEVLQTGSVIEREFPYELIHRVTNLPEKDLLSRLSVLEDTELLYERGIYPQSAYIFKHSLTREVVYGAILAKKRRELHRAVGEAMEALYQKSLAAHLGTLCDHFIAGENYEKGESYARLAARKVEKSGSLAESIDYEKNRIACLERLPKAEEIERRLIDARVTLGLYHMQVDQLQEAKAAVDPVIERVRAASPGRRLGQIYTILGNHSYWVSEDFENTFRYLGEAIRISEVVHDPVSGVLSHYSYGLALAAQCQFEAAIDHVRIAYDINAAARSLWGMATMKSVLSSVHNMASRIPEACRLDAETRSIADQSGDPRSKGLAHYAHGLSCLFMGSLDQAREELLAGLDFLERAKDPLMVGCVHWFLAETSHSFGQCREAAAHYGQAASIWEKTQMSPSHSRLSRASALRSEVMLRQREVDLPNLRETYERNRVKWLESFTARVIAEALVHAKGGGSWAEAECWLDKALEADARDRTHWGAAQDYVLYSELYRRKGDLPRARESLGKAIEKFTECGADGWVKRTEERLAKL